MDGIIMVDYLDRENSIKIANKAKKAYTEKMNFFNYKFNGYKP